MGDRTEFLMFGRRVHEALRHFAKCGGGRPTEQWAKERPHFEHAACGIFLAGSLAYLEGKYKGKSKPWNRPGVLETDFDSFVQKNANFTKSHISKNGLDALICIRNAVTHNDSDLAQNSDPNSLAKVTSATIDGIILNGSIVRLLSNDREDFMEYVRKAYVAVAQYHGDG